MAAAASLIQPQNGTATNVTATDNNNANVLSLIPNDPESLNAYSKFCQERYSQLIQERPDLSHDKEKLAGIIAQEWS